MQIKEDCIVFPGTRWVPNQAADDAVQVSILHLRKKSVNDESENLACSVEGPITHYSRVLQ
jgi:hypothetical protein